MLQKNAGAAAKITDIDLTDNGLACALLLSCRAGGLGLAWASH